MVASHILMVAAIERRKDNVFTGKASRLVLWTSQSIIDHHSVSSFLHFRNVSYVETGDSTNQHISRFAEHKGISTCSVKEHHSFARYLRLSQLIHKNSLTSPALPGTRGAKENGTSIITPPFTSVPHVLEDQFDLAVEGSDQQL